MYAYCNNRVVITADRDGQWIEMVFDFASLGLSVAEVIKNPTDWLNWLGLVGDLVDLVPFWTGTGELVRAGKYGVRLADGLGELSRAAEFGIDGYNALRKGLKGTGLQAHHIVEKRLLNALDIDANSALSVAVTPTEHQVFTNAWRAIFPYGMDYSGLTPEDVWEAAQKVYADYPDLLQAAWDTLFG